MAAPSLQEQHQAAHVNHNATSVAGLLIALGIIYGDIGTSPLYVMKAIIGTRAITEDLVLGGLSCIFWTLTFQTTLKYVIITLRADNKGEGGILSLYALVRRRARWLIFPAMIGACTLLADGIITPSISISSAVEGLRAINPEINTIPIVLVILSALFFVQQFGTSIIGKSFGPLMFIWFSMLSILGLAWLIEMPAVLGALNPQYAYQLLVDYPGGFWLLGAVFLCTTGAEALYSDLGHCGRGNIRVSWGFVKLSLLLNYAGQSAWLLQSAETNPLLSGKNPFYAMMPAWFLPIGITVATVAAIIASQALISGSYTLISEAIQLNFWPKSKIKYPTILKGQLYLPGLNTMLWAGCVGIVLYFQESEHMEAAYGLAITLTMLMTTILLYHYLRNVQLSLALVLPMTLLFLTIEIGFFVANLVKFHDGGWVSLLIAMALLYVMLMWYRARTIKNRYMQITPIADYIPIFKALKNDKDVPKYATHLVYLSAARSHAHIEWKTIYSIFRKQPKRADVYWFLHIEVVDEPYTMEYSVNVVEPDTVIHIEFRLGFRVQPRINLYFRKAVEEMVRRGEIDITSRYDSLRKNKFAGDFRFVVIKRFLSYENELPWLDKLVMETYFILKRMSLSDEKSYGLDTSSVTVETVPMVIAPAKDIALTRIDAAAPTKA